MIVQSKTATIGGQFMFVFDESKERRTSAAKLTRDEYFILVAVSPWIIDDSARIMINTMKALSFSSAFNVFRSLSR